MGQGLYTKVAQVVAIRSTSILTGEDYRDDHGKVPNTSATAASSGSDLNGMAAYDAARQIKERLIDFACRQWKVEKGKVEFLPNRVRVGDEIVPFDTLVRAAITTACSFRRRLLQDAEDPLGPCGRQGPPLLLLRLWCCLFRSLHRYADRRISGGSNRYPPRCR